MKVGNSKQKNRGFTIVELAIVLVVIAILSVVLFVSFRGIQERSRDAQRVTDIGFITKALEHYYLENKQYPPSGGSTVSGMGSWNTTADGSWAVLKAALDPYTDNTLPEDPQRVAGGGVFSSNYMYYSGSMCGAGARQIYILVYKFEARDQVNTFKGECPGTPVYTYNNMSNYRMSRLTP